MSRIAIFVPAVLLTLLVAAVILIGESAAQSPDRPPVPPLGGTPYPEYVPTATAEPTPEPEPAAFADERGEKGARGARSVGSAPTPAFNVTFTYGDGVINLDWDDIPGAMGYDVYQWDGDGWQRLPFTDGTGREFTVSFDGSSAALGNMENGVGYAHYVVARSVNGGADIWSPNWIETKIAVQALPAPAGLGVVSTTSAHEITVGWDAVASAAEYRVEAIVEYSYGSYLIDTVFVTSTQHMSKVWCNGNFRFAVSARGGGYPYSVAYDSHSAVRHSIQGCPDISGDLDLSVGTTTRTEIPVSWTLPSGAGYWSLVYKPSGAGYDGWVWVADSGGGSGVIRDLSCGSSYDISVSVSGDGVGRNLDSWVFDSTTVWTAACPPVALPPSGLHVTGYISFSARAAWDVVSGAARYRVEYGLLPVGATSTPADLTWVVAGEDISNAWHVVSGLLCERTYAFRVSAAGDGGVLSTAFGPPSSAAYVSLSRCYAPPPTNLEVVSTTTSSGVHLSWDASPGVEEFQVEATKRGSVYRTATTTSKSIFMDRLSCNEDHRFYVKGRGDGDPYLAVLGHSAFVDLEAFRCVPLSVTRFRVATTTDESVTLQWDANAPVGEATYEINNRMRHDPTESRGYLTQELSVEVERLRCGRRHDFELNARALYVIYSGSLTLRASAYTEPCDAPAAPDDLRVVSTSTDSVGLSWSAVEGAVKYKLERSRVVGMTTSEWTVVSDAATSTSLIVGGLDCGQTYQFRVSAGGGGFGPPSAGVPVSTDACLSAPHAPAGLRVVSTSTNSVGLSWNAVTSTSQYRVEYARVFSGTSTPVWRVVPENATGTSALVDILVCDVEYRFGFRLPAMARAIRRSSAVQVLR